MNFSLPGQLPPGGGITSTKLRLFCFRVDTASNLATTLHVSDTWSETAIT